MLREIRDLGFEHAELSHGIRISLLPGIIEAVEAGEIKISTLHNFCPLPMGVNVPSPNLFKFTSLDQRERESAYKYTLKTIETASRLKAQLVVLHMGCVEMKDYTEKLIDMVGQGKQNDPKYAKLCDEVLERRELKKEAHSDHADEMLTALIREAEARGIRLGIENREALEEIPFESDFGLFFKRFPSPTVGYWHDTGHAQIKENLGMISHLRHLESMAGRLYGFHVHDVEFPGRDHRAPGSGMIDFGALTAYVKPEHIKVFEFSPSLTSEQAASGVAHIKRLWGND